MPVTPAPAVDQVLTEGSLIIHGVERLPLTERLNDTAKRIDSVVVAWPSPLHVSHSFSGERMLRALGVMIFISVVLAIFVKIIGSMMYGLRKLT